MLALGFAAFVVLSFALGAIPHAILVGVGCYGVDVREKGSGNTGSTNVIRVLGWKPGTVVFILDVAKGAVSVLLSYCVAIAISSASGVAFNLELVGVVAAVAAVLGHVFSPYLKFHGGKGVACGLGGLLATIPLAGLCAFGVFAVVTLATRYVSLGSILAGISLPFFVLLFHPGSIVFLVYGLFITVTLLVTHRNNIARLARHEESRISFHKSGRQAK